MGSYPLTSFSNRRASSTSFSRSRASVRAFATGTAAFAQSRSASSRRRARSDAIHLATDLLGRDVSRRPLETARRVRSAAFQRDRRSIERRADELRVPPIGEIDLAEIAEQDVLGLDVAMENATLVRVRE